MDSPRFQPLRLGIVCARLEVTLTPGYTLTSEDLELGATDERGHGAFVLLGLGHLT